MSKRLNRPLLGVAFAALALGACNMQPKVEPNALPSPAEYKQPLLDHVRSLLADPTGIRDAYISEPTLTPIGRDTRYVVCIRFNPRDARGQYSGNQEIAATFYDRRITQFTAETRELCARAQYQPFPELEKLCRELRCPA